MYNTKIAIRIKKLCKIKSIPVSKLLIDCNVRKSLIYDLEKRDKSPSTEIIGTIANYLDCSVDYLLGRTDKQEVNK